MSAAFRLDILRFIEDIAWRQMQYSGSLKPEVLGCVAGVIVRQDVYNKFGFDLDPLENAILSTLPQ